MDANKGPKVGYTDRPHQLRFYNSPLAGRGVCLFVLTSTTLNAIRVINIAPLVVCPRLSISFPLVNKYFQKPKSTYRCVPFAVEELELQRLVSPEPPAWRGGSW